MLKRLLEFFSRPQETPDPMKYLIVGLGNPGPEYYKTRHNVGFEILDHLAKEFEVSFKDDRLGYTTSFRHKGRSFYLLKPTTFMNLSGRSVLYWAQKLNIQPQNLLVIVDDLNINFGKLRMRAKGNDGGHNGLKDINAKLSSQKYARLRFGIGNEFSKGRQADYVLGKWSEEEEKTLPAMVKKSADAVKAFGTIGLARAMNQYNG